MQPVLTTQRLTLRPVVESDLDAIRQLLVLPDVRRFLCDDVILPPETVARLVARAGDFSAQGLGLWVILRGGETIGLIALHGVADILVAMIPELAGQVEPTVALAPGYWGQGLAGEALAAILNHGFASCGLQQIAALADVPNTASQRMLVRAGFDFMGEHPGLKYTLRRYVLRRR